MLKEILKLKYPPVAIIFADEKPKDALEYKSTVSKGPCALALVKKAFDGKTVAFGIDTLGCFGAKVGFGFADDTLMPGGIEYYLSCGRGKKFPEGEKLKKTPDIAKEYYDNLPKKVMHSKYIIFKPIEKEDYTKAKLVMFLANPDQLSALVSLYSFDDSSHTNILAPMVSGCASIVKLPLNELRRDKPKAIVGLLDVFVRSFYDEDILSFTVPFDKYITMNDNSKNCFLQENVWNKVRNRIIK